MSEFMLNETQSPDLIMGNEYCRQLVFYPTAETAGRCLTICEPEIPTSAEFFRDACWTASSIGSLLLASGISVQSRTIWSQKHIRLEFPHPSIFDGRLQAIAVANPDFQPPRFEPLDGTQYDFGTLADHLGRGVMPIARRGYSTVHDYEVHVPTLSVMCPELFAKICEQSQTIGSNEQSKWLRQTDTLAQLGTFGSFIVSTSTKDLREPMTHWLEEHTSFSTVDAMRLAYHSENYRREVITPVVSALQS